MGSCGDFGKNGQLTWMGAMLVLLLLAQSSPGGSATDQQKSAADEAQPQMQIKLPKHCCLPWLKA